jgi:glycosyltransferase involved in cell wall biosynthesis
MRLLLWAPNGAGQHYNGPGMSAHRLLSKLTPEDRLDVALAHGFREQTPDGIFSAHHLVSPVNGSVASQAMFIWRSRPWLERQKDAFDVFYGLQAFDFTVTPALYAQRMGKPAIVKVVQHNSDLAGKAGWRRLLARANVRRKILAKLSGVVAISDAIFEELIGYGVPERKIARIPNGVDTDRFRPCDDPSIASARRAELGCKDEPTVLFVGAVTPRKRPHLLVEALGMLKGRGCCAHLILAGPVKDPAYAEKMRRMADELGIGERITWTGFVADPASLYWASDIFSLPSSNEGMPNALMEAMASGLPSVVTPVPGSSDLVRDGTEGLFVEPMAAQMADALEQYVRSPQLRRSHGSAARDRAVEHFGARRILDRHIQLYKRVLNGKDAAED